MYSILKNRSGKHPAKFKLKEEKKAKKRKDFTEILKVLFVLFSFILLYSILIVPKSQPGDLFFTVKAFIEDINISRQSDPLNKTQTYFNVLQDRIESFNNEASKNNCIDIYLIEEQLLSYLKTSYQNSIYLDSKDRTTYFEDVINASKNIPAPECNYRQEISEISFVFELMIAESDSSKLDKEVLYKMLADFEATVEKYKYDPTKSAYKDIYTKIEQNNIYIEEILSKDLYFEALIKLKSNSILANLLDAKQANDFQFATNLVCILQTDALCTTDILESTWNSVYSQADKLSQIDLAENIFRQYYSNISEQLK